MSLKINPLDKFVQTKHFDGAIDFDRIKAKDFSSALNSAIKLAKSRIRSIRKKPASFQNTILGLENAAHELQSVAPVFFNLYAAYGTPELTALVQKISNKIEDFQFDIAHDQTIFEKVEQVYKDSLNSSAEKLETEDRRLVEKVYKDFCSNGSRLSSQQKRKLQEIDRKLSILGQSFSQNVESAKSEYRLVIDDVHDLKGLPKSVVRKAKSQAATISLKNSWVFTLEDWSYIPFMKFSENATLREKLWRAQGSLCVGGKFDNRRNIVSIIRLRAEKAALFGENSFADLTIKDRMLDTTESVSLFLDRLLSAATKAGFVELGKIQETFGKSVNPWDVDFVSTKLKKDALKFDEETFRKHLSVPAVTQGIVALSKQLFGLKLKRNTKIPVYHKDVIAFSVFDSDDQYIGLLYLDYFQNKFKQRAGAWMTTYREQYYQGTKRINPHVAIVFNFAKGENLNLEDLELVLHELGHAFHELLSDCKYRSLAGTKVNLDFVELPSHLLVNWAHHYAGLKLFAKNVDRSTVSAIQKTLKFQRGLTNHMQTRLMKIDLAWSSLTSAEAKKIKPRDVEMFENLVLESSNFFPVQPGHNRSCSFENIFTDEYAASFYSYKWAQILDADVFTEFQKKGLFHKQTTLKLKKSIYSQGSQRPANALFQEFKGRPPSLVSYLEREGLSGYHSATKL